MENQKKLGILVIHGGGQQRPSFADILIRGVNKRLRAKNCDPGQIEWERVYWADILDSKEKDLWARLRRNDARSWNPLNWLLWKFLRWFMIFYVADGFSYHGVPERGTKSTYQRIHERVRDHVRSLQKKLGGDKPVVWVGHSLGTNILSNYIWDRQARALRGESDDFATNDFEWMNTVCGIVTCGSILPLFAMAYAEIEPIQFPPPKLKDLFPRFGHGDNAKVLRWVNYYDLDDVLANPLRPISDHYEKTAIEDKAINVGPWWAFWNPACHSYYFESRRFANRVSDLVDDVLQVLR